MLFMIIRGYDLFVLNLDLCNDESFNFFFISVLLEVRSLFFNNKLIILYM